MKLVYEIRRDYTITSYGARINRHGQVWVDPPRMRTILLNDRLLRLAFPWMIYVTSRDHSTRFMRRTTRLLVLGSLTAPERLGSDHLFLTPLPNTLDGSGVCFGDHGALLLKSDEVNPIDLFWNTGFTHGLGVLGSFVTNAKYIAEWVALSTDPEKWRDFPWVFWWTALHDREGMYSCGHVLRNFWKYPKVDYRAGIAP